MTGGWRGPNRPRFGDTKGQSALKYQTASRWYSRPDEQTAQEKLDLIARFREKLKPDHETLLQRLGNRELPIEEWRQTIIESLANSKAMILGGETGSGKSTQLPQIMLAAGFDKVFVLEPTRLNADNIYARLVEEVGWVFGEEEAKQMVGVAHGGRSDFSDDSKIMVMTSNTYTQMSNKIREDYGEARVGIIPDEIHQNDMYTDVASAIAAWHVDQLDGNWAIVPTSATHNYQALEPVYRRINGGEVPIINVEGRPHQISYHEEPDKTVGEVYAEIGEDHSRTLVFTSGKAEIDEAIEGIKKQLKAHRQNPADVVFLPLHAELTTAEINRINYKIKPGERMVIVATPFAMTGVTIPGVDLVICDGMIKHGEVNEQGASGVVKEYLSKMEIIQQIGRGARDVPDGVAVLAKPICANSKEAKRFPFKSMADRHEFGTPEIYRSSLTGVMLNTANLGFDLEELQDYLPNRISQASVIGAKESLIRIGAMNEDYSITEAGQIASRLPARPEFTIGVAEAFIGRKPVKQIGRMALIASALEAGSVYSYFHEDQEWRSLVQQTEPDDLGASLDLMTLEIPEGSQREREKFIKENGLSIKRYNTAKKMANKILGRLNIDLKDSDLTLPSSAEMVEIREFFARGLIDYVFAFRGSARGEAYYQNVLDEAGDLVTIGNRSVIEGQPPILVGLPRYYRAGPDQPVDYWLEQAFPVDSTQVAKIALERGIATSKDKKTFYDHQSGRVKEVGSLGFGALDTGHTRELDATVTSNEARKVLTRELLENPTPAAEALLLVADELKRYQERLPRGQLEHFVSTDSDNILTREKIQKIVFESCASTPYKHEVDGTLRSIINEQNLTISRYLTEASRKELQRLTPDALRIEALGYDRPLIYRDGRPYITGSPEIIEAVKGQKIMIGESREVFVEVISQEGQKMLVSAEDL